ncbi:MAG TPA: hypothetical protein VE442_05445 [Jatrophihabitans sp.]|nr:hypothetical protein [Jatrophihabitans sp.]
MTEWVLIAVAVLIVLPVIAALLLRRAVRRARRRIGGWRWRQLELRTYLVPPGPRREAAQLRSRLHAELHATEDMLQHAPQGLIFRAEASTVLAEVASTAAELDGELAAIERFLDPAQQEKALAAVTAQVEQLIEATYTARHTILRTAVQDRARQLAELRDRVVTQAAAADNYERRGSDLNL